jgi:hypothetical protein
VAIDRDIIFDDVTYPTNAVIESEFNTDIYRFTVGYAFARGPNYEDRRRDRPSCDRFRSLPFRPGHRSPAIRCSRLRPAAVARWRRCRHSACSAPGKVAPHVTVGGRIDYLSLSIDDYDGRLINTQATVTYRVWENVGIGLMYRYVDYRLDVEKNDYFGRIRYKFNGPAIFLQLGF